MRKILLAACFCIFTLSMMAQQPSAGRRAGGAGSVAGRFYGKIVDASGKGVPAASVTLVQSKFDTVTKKQKEVIVGGQLTTGSGDFSIENVPVFAKYNLKITGIGYKGIAQPVAFEMPKGGNGSDPSAMLGALDKDLGNIKIAIDEKMLSNITVTSTTKPAMQLGIDRKVFNVDKNLVSAGGTAIDALKNVPSVSVDIDGNVSLRNNAPQVFVDGRPTNLTLDQIPADAIESFEIITNPSAKFDASGGTAGILNVVLKKAKRVGYSGNIRASVDSRGKPGLGADINIRQNKVNFFASVNYNSRKSKGTGFTDRQTFGTKDTVYNSYQSDKTLNTGAFGFGRAGFDYFIDNRNTITINGNLAHGQFSPDNQSYISNDTSSNALTSSRQERFTQGKNIFKNWGGQASYKHNFVKAGHELTADITYNAGRNENTSIITANNYNYANVFKGQSSQNQYGSGKNENLTLQSDYANPLSDNSKLELGVRAAIRKINSETNYLISGKTSSTIYDSKDNVYAAYATFSNRIGKFGYQAGLRAESSDYNGNLPTQKTSFKVEFPISLFPSLFLSNKLSDNEELQLNYSRRINRPGFFQLFPFTDYSDSLNISRGNPGLKPEFTNSLELSYSKTFKNRDNFLASLYYKNTTNLITRYQAIEFDTLLKKSVLVSSYINANSSYTTGLELTSINKITKWWDLTSNINLFTSKIKIEGTETDQYLSYFAKLNNTFKLPKNFSIQLSGDYQSKTIANPSSNSSSGGNRGGGGGGFFGGPTSAAQGYIRPNYSVDAGIRFEFLKTKTASVSLNVNDIFRTRRYSAFSQSPYFEQTIERRRDPQVFRLNFSYRFGKFDANLFKRKNTKADNNAGLDNANF